MMIDGACAHWSLPMAQYIWLFSGGIYLMCGIAALAFQFADKKYDSAFKTALFPIFVVVLQLLSFPFLNDPIRDCGLYG